MTSLEQGNLNEFPIKPNVLKFNRAFNHNSIDNDSGLFVSNKSNSKKSVVNMKIDVTCDCLPSFKALTIRSRTAFILMNNMDIGIGADSESRSRRFERQLT